jgi:hypothetical protein
VLHFEILAHYVTVALPEPGGPKVEYQRLNLVRLLVSAASHAPRWRLHQAFSCDAPCIKKRTACISSLLTVCPIPR